MGGVTAKPLFPSRAGVLDAAPPIDKTQRDSAIDLWLSKRRGELRGGVSVSALAPPPAPKPPPFAKRGKAHSAPPDGPHHKSAPSLFSVGTTRELVDTVSVRCGASIPRPRGHPLHPSSSEPSHPSHPLHPALSSQRLGSDPESRQALVADVLPKIRPLPPLNEEGRCRTGDHRNRRNHRTQPYPAVTSR